MTTLPAKQSSDLSASRVAPPKFVYKMAQAGVFLEQDQFNCSICLDVMRDPVTVPCGHSYCKACIKGYWDQDDYLGIYGCPQCRQSFAPRPVLGRNTMLADVVDKLKKTGLGSTGGAAALPSEPTYAETGDVGCDVCTGRKNKASRSCLVCLASYCEEHLKPHHESPAFQKHRLVPPSGKLQESLCPRHEKLLEVFCRTDQHCICYLCLTEEHKGHDTVLAVTEMTEKKTDLADMQRNSQERIQEREKKVQELNQASRSLTLSTQAALEESERIFTELVCAIERRRVEVKELIRAQERAATAQAQERLRLLERDIAELKAHDGELEQLAQTEDHISFLQNYRSMCTPPVTLDVPGVEMEPGFRGVMNAVSEFQALLEDVCQGGFVNIAEKVNDVTIIQNTKPKVDSDSEPNSGYVNYFFCHSSSDSADFSKSFRRDACVWSAVPRDHGVHFHLFMRSKTFKFSPENPRAFPPPGSLFTCAAVPTPSVYISLLLSPSLSLSLALPFTLSLPSSSHARPGARGKMAAVATISVDEEQLCCPVCLEVLRDPVTIPCGHSYCMDCIKGYWRKSEQNAGCSCPQCRRCFNPRPTLARNTLLAGLVERVKEAGPRESPRPACEACGGRKRRGGKPCARCPASCPDAPAKPCGDRGHGRPHAQKRACGLHCKPVELYCRTDQQLICTQCAADGHSGHHAVPAAEERAEKQKQLEEALRRSKQRSKEKEKELRNTMKYVKRSVQAVEEDSERICGKLLRSVERRHCDVRELLRAEERAALAQAEGLLQRLEDQVEDLRRVENELERLAHTDDHVHFLQKCKTVCGPAEREELPRVDVHPYFSLMILRKALMDLRERVDDVCDRELSRISELIKDEESLPADTTSSAPAQADIDQLQSEPKTRADFLQHCCEVTLDPNTANSHLCLSEGNRRVSGTQEPQHYSDHPERFGTWAQVLGREGLSGRCYWEAEWGGSGEIAVGVSYKGIARQGGNADSRLGCNPKSWSLDLSDGRCTFQHNRTKIETPPPISSRIGVHLDHKAGTLAFYNVSPRTDTMTMLHKVHTVFSQPLYPAFWVGQGSTLKLCPIFNFSA
ncbi:uncharacterized protein LOC143483351 [Brachyhypopomus gauderio]|uniref:uncharacterized protein LOC143483351 n=1 Tax=Brachyhypopomus gauderio TaxID=698409 RepID=UPI0040414BE7